MNAITREKDGSDTREAILSEHFTKGDSVIVTLDSGRHKGEITHIFSPRSFGEVLQYEVQIKGHTTICTAAEMAKNGRLF